MFSKIKAGAKSAAEGVQKAGNKAHLQVEITNIKDKINAEKKKFGSESWDQAAADDWDGVKTVFATHKAAIDDLLAQLKEKEDAVAALDQPKEKKEEKKDEEEKKKEPPVDDE